MEYAVSEFTLASPFEPIPEVPEKTAPEYILRKVREHVDNGKKTFVVDSVTEELFSFKEINAKTQSIASALYKKGFRKGDILIYQTYDMAKLTLVFIGVWRANGILRSSYPEDTAETLRERVEESRARWIYCEENAAKTCLAVAKKINWDVEVIVAGKSDGCTSIYDFMMDDGTEMPQPDLKGDDPAIILCTSGTTGRSKGAVLNQSAVLFQILSTNYFFTLDKPHLIVSKGTHISGCIFPLSLICSGKMAIVMSTITKLNVFKAIDTYKPGFIFGFPTYLLFLVNDPEACNYDFTSLEIAVSGGAPVTPAIEKTIMELPNMKAVVNCYGLTEIVPVASHFNIGNIEEVKIADIPPSSLGKLFSGVLLQIRDPETGEILGPNCKGEICIKTPGVFNRYMNNPKATEEAFVDGWFKTGDVGYYDDNEFIFLVDRAKEIFKYFNNHISPTEIEKVINEHPSVGEVSVIGVLDPNGGGHVPRAFVKIKNSTESTPEEIIDFTNAKLAEYKHIRGGLYFVPELPKGKTGKVVRQLVEQLTV